MINYSECAMCKSNEACCYISGDTASGGYGSRLYDTSLFVWLNGKPAVLGEGDEICDVCTTKLVKEGSLEAYSSALDKSVGAEVSQQALEQLFLLGVRRMHAEYMARSCRVVSPDRPIDDEGQKLVVEFRGQICRDYAFGRSASVNQWAEPVALPTIQTGRSHFLSYVLQGYAFEECPDCSGAARDYASAIVENREAHDAIMKGLLEAIDDT